ncbi:MAG: peptidoglycan recognition family protein [Candidatus Competibacteraceae bacterium]
MAHFFQPTQPDKAHVNAAASGAALSELFIRPGVAVPVGLWGGHSGEPHDLRVFRRGIEASGFPSARVKVTKSWFVTGLNIDVYTITGLQEGDTLVGMRYKDRQPGTRALPVYALRNTPSGMMREATSWYGIQGPYRNRGICPLATPYLALRHGTMGMTVLNDANVGGPLLNVHGLAVHTTAGRDDRSAYTMARWGCVETWNGGGYGASAHFGIAGDGTLVQFVPVDFVAHAQYNPGNQHWISVEVDNNGKKPMNDGQLASLRALFGWVSDSFGVPRQVATGCLFPKTPHFDKVTAAVCARGKAKTTSDPYVACMSRGVSCHWWLEANKTANSHGCPGPASSTNSTQWLRVDQDFGLRMASFCIRERNVLGFKPSRAAAPLAPSITQPVSINTRRT